MLAQKIDRRQGLQRRHIAGAGHDHIGFAAPVVAGPFPDADAGGAMLDRRVHISHCGAGCLPATMTLMRSRLRRQWSVTQSRELASGGR